MRAGAQSRKAQASGPRPIIAQYPSTPAQPHILSRGGNRRVNTRHACLIFLILGNTYLLDPGPCPALPLYSHSVLPKFLVFVGLPWPLAVSAPGPPKKRRKEKSQNAAWSSWSSSTAPRHVGCWWTPSAPLLPVARLWLQSPSRSESGAQDTGNCLSPDPSAHL